MQTLLWAMALASLALGLTLYGLLSWAIAGRTLRGAYGPGATFGVFPGYAWYPGEAVDAERLGLHEVALELLSLEALHDRRRTRLVLSVRRLEGFPGGECGGALMMALARRAQEFSGADVVVVELPQEEDGPSQEGDAVWMVSRDGGGWSGTGRQLYAIKGGG